MVCCGTLLYEAAVCGSIPLIRTLDRHFAFENISQLRGIFNGSSNHNLTSDYKASSYQQYQGKKLINRFNAYAYYRLSQAMDSHNIARGRTTPEDSLSQIQAETIAISLSSDLLFPPEEQQFLATHIRNATYHAIDSLFGHDGFLTETTKLTAILKKFLHKQSINA